MMASNSGSISNEVPEENVVEPEVKEEAPVAPKKSTRKKKAEPVVEAVAEEPVVEAVAEEPVVADDNEGKTLVGYKVESAGVSALIIKPKYYNPELHPNATPVYK